MQVPFRAPGTGSSAAKDSRGAPRAPTKPPAPGLTGRQASALPCARAKPVSGPHRSGHLLSGTSPAWGASLRPTGHCPHFPSEEMGRRTVALRLSCARGGPGDLAGRHSLAQPGAREDASLASFPVAPGCCAPPSEQPRLGELGGRTSPRAPRPLGQRQQNVSAGMECP